MVSVAKKTRFCGPLLNPDFDFPPLKSFSNSKKLPTYGDVIGVLRYILECQKTNIQTNQALNEVKKRLYGKWYHDSVYCVSQAAILKRLQKDWKIFKEGKRRIREERTAGTAIAGYKCLREKANALYDIAANSPERIQQCAEEFGVKMSSREYEYLEDQRTARKMECDKGVDPIWYAAMLRKQRIRERSEQYKRQMEEKFLFVDIDKVGDLLNEQGAVSDADEPNSESFLAHNALTDKSSSYCVAGDGESTPTSSNLPNDIYPSSSGCMEQVNDLLPIQMRHVRKSDRIIREEIYETLADLKGLGLSSNEACKALVTVANTLFDRRWKIHEEKSNAFLLDTLPHTRNIRHAEELIEAKSLSCVVAEMQKNSEEERMITHATDSTTKKGVGQFAVAGIHIGQNVPFPLPLIPVVGEKTEDIAMQCSLMFEILGATTKKPKEDVYKIVDAHMTDSTKHNKGFAALMADMYDLAKPARQLFCGTHTTLGFAAGMNKQIAIIERDMTLEAIFNNFMVDLDFDSKHGSVAGQALDCMLRLIAPEFQHKPWNYYKQFLLHLQKHDIQQVLFANKDSRFGCLSRAAAVMTLLFPFLDNFLESNLGISNRLACIVRSFLNVEYFKPVFLVFGAFGIQLIEPFYCATIANGTTHSELQEFYQLLHEQMSRPVTESFFNFEHPWFNCVSKSLLHGVRASYGVGVVEAMEEMTTQYLEDCIKIANFIMPELLVILARQRRDYGLSIAFPAQFPIEDQASNIDDTPVSNMAMERICGLVDYRLHKLKQLEPVSRSIILQSTKTLRNNNESSY